MSNSPYVNQRVSNYVNRVRNTMQNQVQTSEARPKAFDIHDRLLYGDSRDRLRIARMREMQLRQRYEQREEAALPTEESTTKEEEEVVEQPESKEPVVQHSDDAAASLQLHRLYPEIGLRHAG